MLIICPYCSQKMKGPASNVGATARCPTCSRSFVVRPPHPAPQPKPVELPIVEGVPVENGSWVGDNVSGIDQPAQPPQSRRDRSAAILDDMAAGNPPADPALKVSHDWYVVVSDFEMDGPYTGREIVTAIRLGRLRPETRLQRGETRTTVAELTKRLKEKAGVKNQAEVNQ